MRPGFAREACLLVLIQLSTGFFWPQEIEDIKAKIKAYGSPGPGVTSYDINALADDATCESIELLYEVADQWDESMKILAMRKLLDLRASAWTFDESCHEKLSVVKILVKWIDSASPLLKRSACQLIAKGGFTDMKKEILPLLNDADYDVKLDCTRTFFDLHAGADDMTLVVEKYPQILSSGYNEIKISVVQSLGELQVKEAFPAVLTMIGSDNPTTRSVALIAAASIDPEKALPHVSSSLHDENFQVRLSAVSALGRIRTPQSLTKLKNLMDDSGLRVAALKEIGRICLPESIDLLLGYLEDGALGSVAAEGLMACAPSSPEKLREALLKAGSGKALSHLLQIVLSAPSPKYLDAVLSVKDRIGGMEPLYLQCLSTLTDRKALIAVLSFTEHKEAAVRLEALGQAELMFEQSGYDALATDVLINAITDEDDSVLMQAVAMAGRWKVVDAAPFLRSLLEAPSEQKRVAAAAALASLGEFAAQDVLLQGLASLSSQVRSRALEAFARKTFQCSEGLLDATTRDPLFFDKTKPGHRERFLAAGSIVARCPDAASLSLIGKLLASKDDDLALPASVAALMSSNETLLMALHDRIGLDGKERLRELAAFAWMAEGPWGRKINEALLGHEDGYVRSAAFLSMGGSKAFKSKEKLARLLAGMDDPFEGARVNAMTTLARMPDVAGQAAEICESLDRPLTFFEAVAALKLGSEAGADCMGEKLERMVISQDSVIKKSAIKAAQALYSAGKESALTEKIHYGLSVCAGTDPDPENKKICSELTGRESSGSASKSAAGAAISITPFPFIPAMPVLSSAPVKKGYPVLKSAATLQTEKGILPGEFSVKLLGLYPPFYPLFFLDRESFMYFIYKGKRCFAGLDADSVEFVRYYDPLKNL